MVMYSCPRCDYETKLKSDIRKHFKRKRACKATKKNISLEECLKDLETKKKPTCEYCNKSFVRNYNLKRHQEKCKDYQIALLKDKVRNLENNSNTNQQTVGQQQNGNNNTINNVTNNVTNNNKIEIHINSYDKTDYSKIEGREHELITRGEFDFGKFIKLIHIDNPENRNIFIKNKNKRELWVYNGEEFELKGRGLQGIYDIIEDAHERIYETDLLTEITDAFSSTYQRFLDREAKDFGYMDKEKLNNTSNVITSMLINARNKKLINDFKKLGIKI